jgi:hypothetical protein
MPKHKPKGPSKASSTSNKERIKQRKSPRLQEQGSKGKTIIKKAQELVAKKCGILEEQQEMDQMTL